MWFRMEREGGTEIKQDNPLAQPTVKELCLSCKPTEPRAFICLFIFYLMKVKLRVTTFCYDIKPNIFKFKNCIQSNSCLIYQAVAIA